MKKVSVYLSAVMICALLSVNNPVIAQTADNTTGTTATTDKNDDDSGKWGLAGLLGLLGLLGLKRREDDRPRHASTNR